MSTPFDRIQCVQGDLTLEAVDAIVNAANESLRGGGGVDGAIHRAAGPELLEELRRRYPRGISTGEAAISEGHDLPARAVIHSAGPVWRGGGAGEARLLAACHSASLELAARHGLVTLSFPAISCGIYGYPPEEAAQVALAALGEGLARFPDLGPVRMVLFTAELRSIFQAALDRQRAASG